MKKLLLITLLSILISTSYSQTYAYTNSYKFLAFNETTGEWNFINSQKQYSRFMFLSEDYFLIESENNVSKYDVIESETINEITMFTIKEATGKIYYMSMDSENITFLYRDDEGLYQVNFEIYLWENK